MDCNINEEKIKAMRSLKTARGQIDGIIKMIEDNRYCIDISNQIMASQSLLKKANLLILKQHLTNCVVSSVEEGDITQKVSEIVGVLSKILDK